MPRKWVFSIGLIQFDRLIDHTGYWFNLFNHCFLCGVSGDIMDLMDLKLHSGRKQDLSNVALLQSILEE